MKRIYTRKTITKQDFNLLQKNVIVHLYTLLDPIRLDFANMRVVDVEEFRNTKKDNSTNYLLTSRGKYTFFFFQFKSAKYHKLPIVIKCPVALQRILKLHIALLRKRFKGPTWLLFNNKGEQMTRNSLSKTITSIFREYLDKNISSSLLRTIFLSHKYSNTDILEREQTAKRMMHSRPTAEAYYIKKLSK